MRVCARMSSALLANAVAASARQWSMNFVNSRVGQLGTPLVGSLPTGAVSCFGADTTESRTVLVRGVWSDIKPDAHQYEEPYSVDGGKEWTRAFIANLARQKS